MLAAERGASRNTLLAYRADLAATSAFLAARGLALADADAAALHAFAASLHGAGLSARTTARRLSALRQFHRFLLREGVRADDPTELLDRPKIAAPLPKYLSEAEVTARFHGLLAASRSAWRWAWASSRAWRSASFCA